MSNEIIYFILFLLALIFVYILYRRHFKRIKVPSVCLITGGVKTGKSLLACKLSMKDYKKRHRRWWLKIHLLRKQVEEPLFYTNVAMSFGNLKSRRRHRLDKNIKLIKLEHLLREERFNYKSVIYICESSLMADSQDFNDNRRNAELSMFNKLISHETKGGVLYYDTQSPLDNHYSIKRVMSTYFFIQKNINLFLFRVLYVREMINSDLGENNFNEDVDLTTRKVLIGRWWYKKYDRYYYSYLTDKLSHKVEKPKFYKGGLNSFNPLYRMLSLKNRKKVKKNEKKED